MDIVQMADPAPTQQSFNGQKVRLKTYLRELSHNCFVVFFLIKLCLITNLFGIIFFFWVASHWDRNSLFMKGHTDNLTFILMYH